MVVVFVLGLLMSLMAAIIAPLMRSQARSLAKLDTVQSAAAALYRMQRDMRQTYYLSAFACTTGSSATCSRPTTLSNATTAIAFPTAYQNGNGQFQTQPSGYPAWSGFMVYWIDAAGDLNWAYDPSPTGFVPNSHAQTAASAAAAVAAATTGAVSGTEIAQNVQQLELAIPGATNVISFQMQAQSTENGSVNETTYRSDILARQ
jgi:hypothetical protein